MDDSTSDPRFMMLLKQYPTFPVEYVAFLYRLDRISDRLDDQIKEIAWLEKKTVAVKKDLEDKAIKQLEKGDLRVRPTKKAQGSRNTRKSSRS